MSNPDVPAVDPMTPLLARVQTYADAHPDASPTELEGAVSEIAGVLGMLVQKQGRVHVDPTLRLGADGVARLDARGTVVIKGWSFDIRPWLEREFGIVIGKRR